MNNIEEMPPKCHDCPYWEIAKPPYYCPDCEDALNKEMIPMIERCVCCGAEIPEGRMICPACERAIIPDDCKGCPHNANGKNEVCSLTGAPIGGRTHCGKDRKA